VVADLGFWLMLGAIVGSRLWHVVAYWQEEFVSKPWWEIFAIRHGGLVFYGGLVGASLATIFYARSRQVHLWKLADVLAPSIALGHVFGRIGCLTYGCCFGLPTERPWAVHYPVEHFTQGVGVHPTQVYEAGVNLLLYAALAWQYRRKTFDGQVFASYLIAYAGLRFLLEFFRGDYEVRHLGGWATAGHIVSLLVLVTGVALYGWLRRTSPAAGKL
jgi:phosphatidylglycerol:prolipoprotein diacylglycerol transferase